MMASHQTARENLVDQRKQGTIFLRPMASEVKGEGSGDKEGTENNGRGNGGRRWCTYREGIGNNLIVDVFWCSWDCLISKMQLTEHRHQRTQQPEIQRPSLSGMGCHNYPNTTTISILVLWPVTRQIIRSGATSIREQWGYIG